MLPLRQSLLQVEKGRYLVDSGQFFRSGSTLQCKTTSIGWHITVSLGSACNFLWEPVHLNPTVRVSVLLGAVGEFVKSETSWDGFSTSIPPGNIRNAKRSDPISCSPLRPPDVDTCPPVVIPHFVWFLSFGFSCEVTTTSERPGKDRGGAKGTGLLSSLDRPIWSFWQR